AADSRLAAARANGQAGSAYASRRSATASTIGRVPSASLMAASSSMSRGAVHALKLLDDYSGIVQCDGYTAYNTRRSFARALPGPEAAGHRLHLRARPML